MKNNKQLLNNIAGQISGVARMMDEEKDCKEVIIQLKAIKSAVGSLMNRYIEDNALACLGDKSTVKKIDREKISKLIKELASG